MIVVVGGGTMGVGIAASFLAVGETVRIVEMSKPLADEARANVEASLDIPDVPASDVPDHRSASGVEAMLARLDTSTDHTEAQASLVVEAIPENVKLKQNLLASIENVYGAEAVLASNTSSLSITTLAECLTDPSRLVGMHFFNPVVKMQLVEVVVGAESGAYAVKACCRWAELLGKTPIVVKDSPGFATSRLGVLLGMEAIRMVEAGVASVEDVDAAMQLGYRHPMGPLKLSDLVGLDVRQAIAEYLAEELGSRFEPPELLRSMVRDGKLGKKSGQGFYTW